MSPRKNFSSGRTRNEKAKRSFGGKKSVGGKPAFKKKYSGDSPRDGFARANSGFSKDGDEKRTFSPSSRDLRPDDRGRKPFGRTESKFGGRRRDDSKPYNSRNHTKSDRTSGDEIKAPYSGDSHPDERERKPFLKPGSRFSDYKRRDNEKPDSERQESKREDRPERTLSDERPAKVRESRDSRSDEREKRPFRSPSNKYGYDRKREDKRPSSESSELGGEDRPERKTGDDARPSRAPYSRSIRTDDRERKPFSRPESKFGNDRRRDDAKPFSGGRDRKSSDDKRTPRPRVSGESRSDEGEKKWNRKSDNEFYGDRRKSGPRSRGFGKKSFDTSPKEDDGTIRLNKYISNAGICSRREADEMIEAGVISVNGEVMTQLGYKVKPDDVVNYGGQTLRSERMIYILLNKPKDFITTADDPEKRKTVMGLIAKACKERVYPVGRLDRNTTGLLLMTNDGDLTRKLTHPSFEVQKIYQVELDKALSQADMEAVEKGVHLEDGFIKVDAISYVGTEQDKSVVGVELHSGRNRIVRRIFEHLGYDVKKLDRVYFAGLSKKDLPRGRWRFLTEMELASLKMMKGSKQFMST